MLFDERMVWVIRSDHPLGLRELSIDHLCCLPQIIIASGEDARVVGTAR